MSESSKCLQQFQKRCSFRSIHSKGAILVLTWTLLTVVVHRTLYLIRINTLGSDKKLSFVDSGTGICVLVAVPFFGWLADAKLGNYKVVKIGVTVSLLASVSLCLFSLLNCNTSLSSDPNVTLRTILLILISLFQWMGAIILVNMFHLSLEQMPDASAENITSLISWFVFSLIAGYWIGDVVEDLLFACVPYNQSDLYQVFTLFPVICSSVNFISFHLISPKWLIIEPKSPQSFKTIYRVLKFAAKHKAPLNRSALTYWEEDIPSRLDLGKSRYGGPFTTEQVEDVKTFFRILAMSVGIFLTMLSLGIHEYDTDRAIEVFNIPNVTLCDVNSLFVFTLHPGWCGVLTVLVYKLLIYRCFRYRLPNSIRRIGGVSFAVVARNIVYLIVSILMYLYILDRIPQWILGIHSVLYGVLQAAMLISSLEFVCAQAPYNMRGLMSGYMQFTFWLAFILGCIFSIKFLQYCQTLGCSIANASVGAAVSIFAFLLYLIIAHWYKRRVRDDIDTPHKWVEDVYDRYLSAAVIN